MKSSPDKHDEIIQKWLLFWKTLTTDQRWLYYKMFEVGDAWPQAGFRFGAEFGFDMIQRSNLEFIKQHFTDDDIEFLDELSADGHIELALECFVKSMPFQDRDQDWVLYAEALESEKSKLYTPELIHVVNKRLLEVVPNRPELLFSIQDREFKELIAEIFEEQGYSVQLTKQTRDNGYDIIAVFNSLVPQKLLIECKRKRNSKANIPIGVVRAVLGAYELSSVDADKIVLVTTNRYTYDAWDAISNSSVWHIDLRDYDDIMRWLQKYQDR